MPLGKPERTDLPGHWLVKIGPAEYVSMKEGCIYTGPDCKAVVLHLGRWVPLEEDIRRRYPKTEPAGDP